MEGGNLAEIVSAPFERDLRIPQLEEAADANHEHPLADLREMVSHGHPRANRTGSTRARCTFVTL